MTVLAFGFSSRWRSSRSARCCRSSSPAVLALGLDPVVGALVKRGWKRGKAALAVFAALFAVVFVIVLVTAGPLWDEIKEFVAVAAGVLGGAQAARTGSRTSSTRGHRRQRRNALKDLAAGLPDAANALLGIAGGVFGSLLSLVTLTFLALFLLMERPDDHRLAVRVHAARGRAALAAGGRGVDLGGLVVAARQRRDLDRRGHRRGRVGVACSACRSRSCSPSSPACST